MAVVGSLTGGDGNNLVEELRVSTSWSDEVVDESDPELVVFFFFFLVSFIPESLR
jgi:hypothetical protein